MDKSKMFMSEPEEGQRLYCDQWVQVALNNNNKH